MSQLIRNSTEIWPLSILSSYWPHPTSPHSLILQPREQLQLIECGGSLAFHACALSTPPAWVHPVPLPALQILPDSAQRSATLGSAPSLCCSGSTCSCRLPGAILIAFNLLHLLPPHSAISTVRRSSPAWAPGHDKCSEKVGVVPILWLSAIPSTADSSLKLWNRSS